MKLHTIADDLAAGRIGLWELPAWAFELYHAGYFARDPEVFAIEQQLARAEADADRYFELWANPGKQLAIARARRERDALGAADRAGELHDSADVFRVVINANAIPRRAA